MTTLEIGNELVELIKAGKNAEAMKTLYASDIISVEAGAPPGQSPESKGVEACVAKGEMFRARSEIHSAEVRGPFPNGDKFAVLLSYDMTDKNTKERQKMEEVALYYVKNDKIVREEFYYTR